MLTIHSNTQRPFISVIIPVYRNPTGLRRCLNALREQTYPQSRFEIIVVDNGDNGNLEPMIATYPNAQLGREETPGSYAARNAGVGLARGHILAFTDSDCIPAPQWLAAGTEALRGDPLSALIAGHIEIFPRDSSRPNAFEVHQVVKGFYPESAAREGNRASAANIFAYREVFKKVGLFRADFQSGGDGEWTHRAVSHGYRLQYAPDALIRHAARCTFPDFTLRYVRTTGGKHSLRQSGTDAPLGLPTLLAYLIPPIRETRKHSAHPALIGFSRKLQFFAVDYWVQGIRLIETLRILLGGRPIRY